MTKTQFNIIHAVADRLAVDYAGPVLCSIRNARILDHYQAQITKGYMDPFTAAERCIGDICGANHNQIYTQRTKPRTFNPRQWDGRAML